MQDQGVATQAPSLEGLISDQIGRGGPRIEDRVRGTMLGLAVGNLLGLPVEGWWYSEIDERYPGGISEINPDERRRPMDDDLAQAVVLAEALVGDSDLINGLATRMVDWWRSNGRGCGFTTHDVMVLLARGVPVPEAARQVYEAKDGIAPNGAVMRCAPVALAHSNNPRMLVNNSAVSSVVTHYAPTCQWSCIIINSVIVMLAHGISPDLTAIYQTARSDGAPDLTRQSQVDRIPSDIFEAIDDRAPLPETCEWLHLDQRKIGHTLLATQVGLWAAATPLGFEDALVAAVSAGGDSDTNGAVAGAVLGARYGAAAIPTRWLDCIPERGRIDSLIDALST